MFTGSMHVDSGKGTFLPGGSRSCPPESASSDEPSYDEVLFNQSELASLFDLFRLLASWENPRKENTNG